VSFVGRDGEICEKTEARNSILVGAVETYIPGGRKRNSTNDRKKFLRHCANVLLKLLLLLKSSS
jgi:hypothetical protein